MREMKGKVQNVDDARLEINGMSWAVVACLCAENAVLFVEN